MAQVHPTAIVSDQAQLADDLVIGPWCMVEGPVTIGDGTRLLHGVSLQGPLTIGRNNLFYPGAAIGFAPQDLKYDHDQPGAGVAIGDGNTLREGVTIHRATHEHPTTLGNDNYLMVNSHLAHDCVVGNHCMLANGSLLAGHVQLADRVILGGNAVVHQFCRVGRLSMIAGIRGVHLDLPPFCVVYDTRLVSSLNLVGLRRAGYREHIHSLNQAFKVFFRDKHTKHVALQIIEQTLCDDPLVREFAGFIRSSTRGVVGYASSRDRRTSGEPESGD